MLKLMVHRVGIVEAVCASDFSRRKLSWQMQEGMWDYVSAYMDGEELKKHCRDFLTEVVV